MTPRMKARVKAFGIIADFALAVAVVLATIGIVAAYYNPARAIQIEGLAIIMIIVSLVATVRGMATITKEDWELSRRRI